MRLFIATLLASVLAVASVQPAQAGWRINRATAIARIVWHNPNVDQMTLRWGPLPEGLAPDSAAWVYAGSTEAWLLEGAPQTWESFCSLVLHEAGHIAGAAHADHGVMMHPSAGVDPRCALNGLPYLRAHGYVGTGTLR